MFELKEQLSKSKKKATIITTLLWSTFSTCCEFLYLFMNHQIIFKMSNN